MRQIAGKRTTTLTAAAFAELRDRHRRALLDVGTGDGRRVLHTARC